MNPLTKSVHIPWNGKTYPCHLNNGSLARAEFELNISIISPSEVPFGSRPLITQFAIYLYAMMARKPFVVTLDDCMDAVTGENGRRIMDRINEALEALLPDIKKLAKNLGAEEQGSPLAPASGGLDSTPPLASSSELESANSGA